MDSTRKTSREWRHSLTLFLFCLGVGLPQPGSAGINNKPTITTRWDIPVVEQQTPSERILEILVETNLTDSPAASNSQPPIHLSLVIDRSGSMGHEGKLTMAKQAATEILGRLQYGDRFSLLTYSDSVEVLLSSVPAGNFSPHRQLINAIEPGGSTFLSGGLEAGYREILAHFDPTAINRVLLLSDGLANRGITSPSQLSEIVENQARQGISLSTCGVGYEFNEDLMAELSERGRGMYYYAEESATLADIFTKEFANMRHLAAKNVEFQLDLMPGVDVKEIYANSYQVQGRHITIQAGDLSAGELRRIQLRVQMGPMMPGTGEIGQLSTSYRLPSAQQTFSERRNLSVTVGNYGRSIENYLNRGIVERSVVFSANRARSDAAQAIEEGNLILAKQRLDQALQQLTESPVQGQRIDKEIQLTKEYRHSLRMASKPSDRIKVRKRIKHKSYMLEGC